MCDLINLIDFANLCQALQVGCGDGWELGTGLGKAVMYYLWLLALVLVVEGCRLCFTGTLEELGSNIC